MSSSDKIAFPKQSQPWPGLARAITPRSDHAEKIMQRFGTDTPKGLPGRAAELASECMPLAASECSYATAQVYGDSGGRGAL
ncbi:hypothetical protein [Roseateles sp. L2-2]|uniref:hypothetical protein n=1 Tax=Roseateles sp. L2-2 TaxID=3422597 RepID=UPI003D363F13